MINIQPACFFQTANTPSPPGEDPYLANVILHLTGDDFTDSTGKTVVNQGTVAIDNTVFKTGTGSLLFDGSNTSHLSIESNDFTVGTQDFCIEYWIRPTVTNGNDGIWCWGSSTTVGANNAIDNNIYLNTFRVYGTNIESFTSRVNIWTHVACCRTNNVITHYFDGIADATTTTNSYGGTSFFLVGKYFDGAGFTLAGNLDSFRVTVGTPRYTANFNPETDTYLD